MSSGPLDSTTEADPELPSARNQPAEHIPATARMPPSGPPRSATAAAVPFPHRLPNKKLEAQFAKFLEAISKVHINIPLVEALQEMPNYAKFLKDVVTKKKKWGQYETVRMTENCSAIIQKRFHVKHKDPGSFTLSCVLGNNVGCKALCDLGASINLMPLSFYGRLNIENLRPTSVSLQMADRSIVKPSGII